MTRMDFHSGHLFVGEGLAPQKSAECRGINSAECRVKSAELRLILLDAKSSLTFAQANISSLSDITRRSRISLWAKPTILCILHLIFSRVVVGADPYRRFAYLFIIMYVSIAGRLKLTSKPKGLRLNSASMYVSLIGQ